MGPSQLPTRFTTYSCPRHAPLYRSNQHLIVSSKSFNNVAPLFFLVTRLFTSLQKSPITYYSAYQTSPTLSIKSICRLFNMSSLNSEPEEEKSSQAAAAPFGAHPPHPKDRLRYHQRKTEGDVHLVLCMATRVCFMSFVTAIHDF